MTHLSSVVDVGVGEDDDLYGEAFAESLEARAGAEVRAHIEYQTRPIEWMRDVLGVPERTLRWSLAREYRAHEWDGTRDPLAAACEALADWRNVGIESATGTGKTYLCALLTLWFLACWPQSIVRTHAPKADQLTKHMWKEIGALFPKFVARFPQAEISHLRIRMLPGPAGDKWSATGVVAGIRAEERESGSATKAQGAHAEHMLLICEETPGVAAPIMNAIVNTATAPHNLILAVGNPDHQQDELHKFCTAPGTQHIRISAYDHPNVVCNDPAIVPGATSRGHIARQKERPGEGSPLYESRVRGISPAQAVDALVRLEWLERAAARWLARDVTALSEEPRAMGVDVAQSENGDKAAIAKGQGHALLSVRSFQCQDATRLGSDAWTEAQSERIAPSYIGIDPVGVGAATLNELRRKHGGHAVQALYGSAHPVGYAQRGDDAREWMVDENLFDNLRSQMWWQLREDLRLDQVDIYEDASLFRQLTLLKYTTDGGKVKVESKRDLKKRTGADSPNDADAVIYWNWVRPRKALAKAEEVPREPMRDRQRVERVGIHKNDSWSSGPSSMFPGM